MVTRFVVDASVTAAWCFRDEATAATQALRRGLTDGCLVVPLLWHAECANLLLMAERRGRVTRDQRMELLELLGALPTETDSETDRIRGPITRLATEQRLTIYDAIYLDLAQRRTLPLATRDKDLIRSARAIGVTLIET